jgi:RNA polymerase sigma-70 factor (ECF subfamily)
MDITVVERARQGDDEAFAAIYACYQPAIRRHAGRLVRNPDLADDLTQETFIRAYQHRAQLRPEPQLRAWLYRIASNACLDAIRRSARHAPAPPQADAWEPAGPDFAPQIVEADAVRQALAAVRPSLRVPLLLFLAQDLSCKEIAARLQISAGSVAVRLYRARAQFAQAYAQTGR